MRLLGIFLLVTMIFGNAAAQPETYPTIPPEVEQAAAEWPLANRDYENTRAMLDAEIAADNVDTLDVAWGFEIPGVGAWGAAATTPLIAHCLFSGFREQRFRARF